MRAKNRMNFKINLGTRTKQLAVSYQELVVRKLVIYTSLDIEN